MLQNTRVTGLTVSELLSENQQEGGKLPTPPPLSPPPPLQPDKVAILPKRELDFPEEALKILMYLQENLLGTKIFR